MKLGERTKGFKVKIEHSLGDRLSAVPVRVFNIFINFVPNKVLIREGFTIELQKTLCNLCREKNACINVNDYCKCIRQIVGETKLYSKTRFGHRQYPKQRYCSKHRARKKKNYVAVIPKHYKIQRNSFRKKRVTIPCTKTQRDKNSVH